MKKLLIIVIISAAYVFGQSNKGNISLVFNDEKFDIPIRYISINKDDNIRVSIRAEQNDSLAAKWISMELTFSNLAGGKNVAQPKGVMLQIQSSTKYGEKRKSFMLNYGNKNDVQIELYDHGDRFSFTANKSFEFVMNVEDISYKENQLRISGKFSVNIYKKSEKDEIKVDSSIKDGKFEIIL